MYLVVRLAKDTRTIHIAIIHLVVAFLHGATQEA